MTDKEFENLAVGKRFVVDGIEYEVVEGCHCYDCSLNTRDCLEKLCDDKIPGCINREDNKRVIFKEVKE